MFVTLKNVIVISHSIRGKLALARTYTFITFDLHSFRPKNASYDYLWVHWNHYKLLYFLSHIQCETFELGYYSYVRTLFRCGQEHNGPPNSKGVWF